MGLLDKAALAQREAKYHFHYDMPEWTWEQYRYERVTIDCDEYGSAVEWEHLVTEAGITQITIPFDKRSGEFHPDTLSIWLDLGRPSPEIIGKKEFDEGDLDLLATLVDDYDVDISSAGDAALRVLIAMIETD